MDLDVGEFLDSLQLNNLKDIFEKEQASSMKRLENTCTDFKRAKYIRRGGFEFANSAHIMKPFRKSRVQFVSDAFAFVSDCQCVLLPRSLGMCLSTWAMRNLKRLESTRLVTDTKSSRQLKKNSLAYQNWVSEFCKRTYRGCWIKNQKLNEGGFFSFLNPQTKSEKSAKKPVDKSRAA